MRKEVLKLPVGEHDHGIYTLPLVCHISVPLYTQLILRVFPIQSYIIWVSIDPLLELGVCSLCSSLHSSY